MICQAVIAIIVGTDNGSMKNKNEFLSITLNLNKVFGSVQ